MAINYLMLSLLNYLFLIIFIKDFIDCRPYDRDDDLNNDRPQQNFALTYKRALIANGGKPCPMVKQMDYAAPDETYLERNELDLNYEPHNCVPGMEDMPQYQRGSLDDVVFFFDDAVMLAIPDCDPSKIKCEESTTAVSLDTTAAAAETSSAAAEATTAAAESTTAAADATTAAADATTAAADATTAAAEATTAPAETASGATEETTAAA